ncbi:MAG: hypothetical protein LUF68_07850 [Clostridiales bacterium]|nr:hypothetical protein [Clostridiales bacterium]MCD8117012.1 hypothetical protein [Oscillospiraceae bacterium]
MNQAYRDAWDQVELSHDADQRIMSAIAQGRPRPVSMKKRRMALKMTAAIVAAVLALSCAAMAVGGFSYEEISESLRLLLGIDGGAVPEYIQYDTVTEAENARNADVHHSGAGEVYATAGSSVYSESFLTVELWLSTVTEEQYQSYVWRVQLQGAEDAGYIPAEPVCYQSGRWAVVRVTILRESIQSDSLRLTVCGGLETEENTFTIERIGTVSVDVPATDESVYLALEDISFENRETGETGQLTGVEIHTGCLILYYHIEGIYDMERRYFQDAQAYPKYIDWQNSALRFLSEAGTYLTLTDGTALTWLPTGGCIALPDDTLIEVMYFSDSISPEDVVSVTIGGETYDDLPDVEQTAADR